VKNAHLRFGSMRFHRTVGNSQNSFSLRADRLIAEREVDGGAKVHFLSVIGGDAQIAAAGAILSENHPFSIEGPGVPTINVRMGKDAGCYRASIQLSSRKRPLRHLVAVSEEFGATAISESKGRTLLADSEVNFIWASMAQTFGLPCVPEWASWFYSKLEDNFAIVPLQGFGLRPVLITGTKKEFLDWMSKGIQKGEITMPEVNGPVAWPALDSVRFLFMK